MAEFERDQRKLQLERAQLEKQLEENRAELENARDRVDRECAFVKEKYMQMMLEQEQRYAKVSNAMAQEVMQLRD
jgi:hypothetical protein